MTIGGQGADPVVSAVHGGMGRKGPDFGALGGLGYVYGNQIAVVSGHHDQIPSLQQIVYTTRPITSHVGKVIAGLGPGGKAELGGRSTQVLAAARGNHLRNQFESEEMPRWQGPDRPEDQPGRAGATVLFSSLGVQTTLLKRLKADVIVPGNLAGLPLFQGVAKDHLSASLLCLQRWVCLAAASYFTIPHRTTERKPGSPVDLLGGLGYEKGDGRVGTFIFPRRLAEPAATLSRHKRRLGQRLRGPVSRGQGDCHAGQPEEQCPLLSSELFVGAICRFG